MILLLMAELARAGALAGASETLVQGRLDANGVPFVAGWETAWVGGGTPTLSYEAYGNLNFAAGFDSPPGFEVFVLAADGEAGKVDWTVGRQRLNLPAANWLLDGGRVAWSPNERVTLELWAGQAEHVGLAAWTDGVPVARVDASFRAGPLSAVVGVLGELGSTPAVHPDLQVTVTDAASKLVPSANLVLDAGVDSEGAAALEKGRITLSARPIPGTRASAWAEHREALNTTSPMAPRILATLAPLGYDEVGAGFGWSAADTSRLWMEGSVQSYAPDPADETYREVGWSGKTTWLPHCAAQSWCLTPSWTAASGPAGAYHAFVADVAVPTPSVVDSHLLATLAPYHRAHEDWDMLAALGATVALHPVPKLITTLGGEVAHDGLHDVDPRVWLSVRLGMP